MGVIKTAHKTDPAEVISNSPVKLVDEIISRAYLDKASDIHIEPGEQECRVRIRIDGSLRLIGHYKKAIHDEAVARLKVLSNLRTDVRTSPQDGRFKVHINATPINIRLSLVPSFYGEKCVLRLLPHSFHAYTLESLGFEDSQIKKIYDSIAVSHGMILVVGPTGSGKTTTLHALLRKISAPDISVTSLEDPIEYSAPEITQIPINTQGNMNFSTALRAVVRQDPDVIMVGEIRDTPTAELSTHAALTGHLLFSTLHTNSAATALPRLVDMGIEPFLIASVLRMVISQRLVRRICTKCAFEYKVTKSESNYIQRAGILNISLEQKLKKGRGCETCKNTGYSGRLVVSEVLLVDEKIRNLIMTKSSSEDLQTAAESVGMTSLVHDGLRKVVTGQTTLEEVASQCHV